MSESNPEFGPSASAEDVVHSLQALRRFAKPRSMARERCELCSIPIGPAHRHLLEMENRKIVCACDPCAMRFTDVVGGHFKLIPRDARPLRDFQMTDAQWEEFVLPINLVFFFRHSHADKMMALYPSPAGATESLLPLNAWESLVRDNPVLAQMEPDVEALLVNRVGQKRDYYLAPIDVCFELAGLIRANWRGFSGGAEVWKKLDDFFAKLNGGKELSVQHTAAGEHPPEVCHA